MRNVRIEAGQVISQHDICQIKIVVKFPFFGEQTIFVEDVISGSYILDAIESGRIAVTNEAGEVKSFPWKNVMWLKPNDIVTVWFEIDQCHL